MQQHVVPVICLKSGVWVANSVDPDQMHHSVATDQGLYYLRPARPKGKCGMLFLIPGWPQFYLSIFYAQLVLWTAHCTNEESQSVRMCCR